MSKPWGVHRIGNVFGRRDIMACGLPDGRYVTAICCPYSGNRLIAAWWVLTGRAEALIWPKPGELEDALGEASYTLRDWKSFNRV